MNKKTAFTKNGHRVVLTAMIVLLSVTLSWAEDDSSSLAGKIKWQRGPCIGNLGDVAEAHIPAGYVFAGPDDTRTLMEDLQNPTSGREKGFIAPSTFEWFLVFEFDDIGYVKDDEKATLDADALLKAIIAGNKASNKERAQRGWSEMNITGWAEPPHYNSSTHNLEWAIRAESEGQPVVNYNTRLLGRNGVMEVVLVADPNVLSSAAPKCKSILDGFTFMTGHKYAEFKPGDKVAALGLSALIVGGAAAVAVKTGMFKWLWKIGVLAFIGVAGFFKKFFSRKQND